MTISLDGELWIPVEITMIGRSSFPEAWRKGSEEWNAYEVTPEKRGFYITRKAQELYRPVGLRETDLGLQYGDKESITNAFDRDMDTLIQQVVSEYRKTAEEQERARDWNKLGIAYASFLRYTQSDKAFSRALEINPEYSSALINRGNVLFLQKKYDQALNSFREALAEAENRQRTGSSGFIKLLLNISRTYYQLKEYDRAQEFFVRAERRDPEAAEEYSYLASAADRW